MVLPSSAYKSNIFAIASAVLVALVDQMTERIGRRNVCVLFAIANNVIFVFIFFLFVPFFLWSVDSDRRNYLWHVVITRSQTATKAA